MGDRSPDKLISGAAICSAIGLLGNAFIAWTEGELSESWWQLQVWLVATLFFGGLWLLLAVSAALKNRTPPSAWTGICAILALGLIWSTYFYVAYLPVRDRDTDVEQREPIKRTIVDQLIFEHNLTVPADEQVPLIEPRKPDVAPTKVISEQPFAWLLPLKEEVKASDGEPVQDTNVDARNKESRFHRIWLPLMIALTCVPFVYLSVPFVSVVVVHYMDATALSRLLGYAAFLIVFLAATTAWVVPHGVTRGDFITCTSIVGFVVIGIRLLLECDLSDRAFWIAAHLWGVLGQIFLSFLFHHAGHFGTPVAIVVVALIAAILVHMALPMVLSPESWSRVSAAIELLAFYLPLAFLVIVAIYAYFIYEPPAIRRPFPWETPVPADLEIPGQE